MSKNRKKRQIFIAMCSAVFAIAFTIGSITPVQAAAGEYQVVFRAGSKGTVGGNTSVTKTVTSGSAVGALPEVTAQSGYYQTGWSPEVAAGTVITKREVFVAQYARITDGVEYRVKYIDESGNALATEKVVQTQKGSTATEQAAEVEGFAPAMQSQSVQINQNKTEIIFTYTSTAEAPVITETETTVVDQITNVAGGTTTASGTTTGNGAAGGTAAGTGNTTGGGNTADAGTGGTTGAGQTQGDNTVTAEDEEVPKGNVEAKDEETPKAKQSSASTKNSMGIIIGVASAVLILAAAAIVIIRRKRLR